MNADAEHDALIGGHADVAFDHRVPDRCRASHRLDHAAELDESPIAGALEHAPVLDRDRGSINSDRSARNLASVRSSSTPVMRLKPTTSAARIAAIFRVSAIVPLTRDAQ